MTGLNDLINEKEYLDLLNTAVTQINAARNSIALQINTTVTSSYWNLGKLKDDLLCLSHNRFQTFT